MVYFSHNTPGSTSQGETIQNSKLQNSKFKIKRISAGNIGLIFDF
jgi:hypothetical protein